MGLLDGRVAIVTGAGRGLGRAHALTLAAAGASVVINDLGTGVHGEESADSPAESVVNEIRAAGGTAISDGSSVSDWQACGALVDRTVAEFGRLDIVVNNAGITRDRMLTSSTEQDFDATFAVHVKGTYAMSHHACRHWREESKRDAQVAGRIVNTTSGSGLVRQYRPERVRRSQVRDHRPDHRDCLGNAPVRRDRKRHFPDRSALG